MASNSASRVVCSWWDSGAVSSKTQRALLAIIVAVTFLASADVARDRTFCRTADDRIHVPLDNGGSFLVTPSHRVSSEGLWVPIGSLAPGAVLATSSGWSTLVASEVLPGPRDVFNIEVTDGHTYFVDVGAGDIWAHNYCVPDLSALFFAVGELRSSCIEFDTFLQQMMDEFHLAPDTVDVEAIMMSYLLWKRGRQFDLPDFNTVLPWGRQGLQRLPPAVMPGLDLSGASTYRVRSLTYFHSSLTRDHQVHHLLVQALANDEALQGLFKPRLVQIAGRPVICLAYPYPCTMN